MLQSYYKSHVYKRGLWSLEDYHDHPNQDTVREDLHTTRMTHTTCYVQLTLKINTVHNEQIGRAHV